MKRIGFISVALSALFLLSTSFIEKKDPPAYLIFTANGKDSNYEQLLKRAGEADVILFGELHNNPIAHWLQIMLTEDLHREKSGNIILGAEMFESDIQVIMNEYLGGKISEKNFTAESRPWVNYKTDIKPLVQFAKEKAVPFIATNTPRRYASLIYEKGFEGLDGISTEAKTFLPPLPIKFDPELPGYRDIAKFTGGHGSANLAKSQAFKDATMAHFILKNFSAGKIFIHYNGAYHSNNYEGIYWYLKQEKPELKILTISTVEEKDPRKLSEENLKVADFIIAVPESMTKTH
jgi:uncharacterized iron-regulated protein